MLKFKGYINNKFRYFDFTDLDLSLKIKFLNGSENVLLIPKNNQQSIVSASRYNFKEIVNEENLIFEYINNEINFQCIKMENIDINILNFPQPHQDYRNIILENKFEYSEYSYHEWAQIKIDEIYPSELKVLGVTKNGLNLNCVEKTDYSVFTFPGTISNYLMQIQLPFKNIKNIQFIQEININDIILKFYIIDIEFSSDLLLYKSSIDKYHKIFPFNLTQNDILDIPYSNVETELSNYKIYNNLDYLNLYIYYNRYVRITKDISIKKAIDTEYPFVYYLYFNDFDITKFNTFNENFKFYIANALVRFYNPILTVYEAGINWRFNLIYPHRYFILNDDSIYYDSLNGLAFNKESHNLILNAPFLDWNGDFNNGYWSATV